MIEMHARNSHAGFGGASRFSGFTIIELMVSLALTAITLALALPSYSEMIDKRRLSSAAEQLTAFVNSAQLQSTRRNQSLTLSYRRSSHTNWCIGLTVGTDACDCSETDVGQSDYCAVDGIAMVLDNTGFDDAELVHNIEGTGSLTFDPIRGILLNADDDIKIELHTDSRDYKVDLLVNSAGNVTLCSHDSGHDLPGFDVCPPPIL
jgi:type IV fimbrial biogenesis protein FimT